MAIMPTTDSKPAEPGWKSRIPELDGFRAIALWMVLSTHLLDGWPLDNGATAGIPEPILALVHRGWLGVDLFFVLSGLLITGILLDSRDNTHYFRNFWGRRALRIMPLYFLVVAVSACFYTTHETYFLLSVFFCANFAFLLGVGIPHGPGVAWSLGVEEQFYLGWPLVVRSVSRRTLTIVCFVILVTEPALRGLANLRGLDPEFAISPLPWFHFDGLALGALLSIWIRSRKCTKEASLRLAGLMLAASVLILVAGLPFGVARSRSVASTALRFTHMDLLFGSAILASLALSGTRATALLRTPFFRVTSDLSYCIYLIHLSIGDGYRALLRLFDFDPTALLGPSWAWRFQCVAIVAVSYGLAGISKTFIEKPFLNLKQRFF